MKQDTTILIQVFWYKYITEFNQWISFIPLSWYSAIYKPICLSELMEKIIF